MKVCLSIPVSVAIFRLEARLDFLEGVSSILSEEEGTSGDAMLLLLPPRPFGLLSMASILLPKFSVKENVSTMSRFLSSNTSNLLSWFSRIVGVSVEVLFKAPETFLPRVERTGVKEGVTPDNLLDLRIGVAGVLFSSRTAVSIFSRTFV